MTDLLVLIQVCRIVFLPRKFKWPIHTVLRNCKYGRNLYIQSKIYTKLRSSFQKKNGLGSPVKCKGLPYLFLLIFQKEYQERPVKTKLIFLGSLTELVNLLIIARELEYISISSYNSCREQVDEISRMLIALRKSQESWGVYQTVLLVLIHYIKS